MTAICCWYCGALACTTCQDAADHPAGMAHCADPECVGRCPDCQADPYDFDDEIAEVPC